MKITRYPQSCLLIEKAGQKIVVDPGEPFLQTHKPEELKGVVAVFYTHEHFDHCSKTLAAQLQTWGAEIYTNKSVADFLQLNCHIVEPGQVILIGGFTVNPCLMAHSEMVDGSPGAENTGYIIDDYLLHPGDSPHVEGVKVPVIALPLVGPDISPRRACDMAKTVGATIALAIHYDLWGAHTDFYKTIFAGKNMPFELKVLEDGESAEF